LSLLITNLTRFQIDKKWLEKIGQRIWQVLGLGDHREVGLVLVTPNRIQELNKQFRHKDKVTDILSFNYREAGTARGVFFGHTGDVWGDLVVCLKQIKDQARGVKKSWQAELTEVLIHGILHLTGQNHTDSASLKAMQDKTMSVLKGLNFKF